MTETGVPGVSVDFAPVLRVKLPLKPEWGWPRKSTEWPSKELIKTINSKGVDLVAKQNFFWTISFAECEKAISHLADRDDSGCRKKVHKIIKKKFSTSWNRGTAVSLYVVKVR